MSNYHPWRLSVAPMLDWTDRHCRYFHRLLSQHARLYTEMIHVGAILHGDVERFLRYDETEHPLALQLGGSEPKDLAACAKLAEQWGYDEVNINCGCPSERVQRGSFGACLMAEPALVADGVKAMLDACNIAVTVKHRIGLDKNEDYAPVRDFVGAVAEAGCQVFVVHARNAWLKGLSPKENRDIPPLRYEVVHQLKKDFPQLSFATNGGVQTNAQIAEQLAHVDGVMVGRQAYHHPWDMTTWDEAFFGAAPFTRSRDEIELEMVAYMEREAARGVPVLSMARHMLGLRNGISGARAWRQVWSDHKRKALSPREIHQQAIEASAYYRVGD